MVFWFLNVIIPFCTHLWLVLSTSFESNMHSETSNTITYVFPNLAQLINWDFLHYSLTNKTILSLKHRFKQIRKQKNLAVCTTIYFNFKN